MAATGLGLRIKQARGRKHLTQRELAALLEVDRKTIDNWENERTRPGADKVAALEAVLGSLNHVPPDPREEQYRDLGRDRGGMLEPHEVEILIQDYRRKRGRPPETRAG